MNRILSTTLTAVLAVASGMSVAANTSKASARTEMTPVAATAPIAVSNDSAKIAAIEKHASELKARDAQALNAPAATAAKKSSGKPASTRAAKSGKTAHKHTAPKSTKTPKPHAAVSQGKSVK